MRSTQVYGTGPSFYWDIWLKKRGDEIESIPSFLGAPLLSSVPVTYHGDGDVFEHPMPPVWRCHEKMVSIHATIRFDFILL